MLIDIFIVKEGGSANSQTYNRMYLCETIDIIRLFGM